MDYLYDLRGLGRIKHSGQSITRLCTYRAWIYSLQYGTALKGSILVQLSGGKRMTLTMHYVRICGVKFGRYRIIWMGIQSTLVHGKASILRDATIKGRKIRTRSMRTPGALKSNGTTIARQRWLRDCIDGKMIERAQYLPPSQNIIIREELALLGPVTKNTPSGLILINLLAMFRVSLNGLGYK